MNSAPAAGLQCKEFANKLRQFSTTERFRFFRHVVISIFAAAYLVLATLYVSPHSPLRDRVLAPFNDFIEYYGLWQAWNMFSPEPEKFNCHLVALVWYDNKTSEEWELPRMSRLNLWDRIVQERWRKYAIDHVNTDSQGPILYPDLARYVAYHKNAPGKHPVSIQLIRRWTEVPQPEEGLSAGNRKKEQKEQELYLFNYDVKARDLQ